MNNRKEVGLFSLTYMLTYLTYAIGTTQFIPYLTKVGYSAVERGILLSSIAVVSIVSQIIFGVLSDKYKTIKRFYIFTIIVFALASYIFYDMQMKNFLLHLVILSLLGGFFNLSMGIGDSWVLETNGDVKKVFSFIRAFGSIGWAIGSISVSYIIIKFGYSGIGATVTLIMAIAIGVTLLLRDASKRYVKEAKTISKADVKKLCCDKVYILVVFILFLLYSVNNFTTYTVVDKLILLGGTSKHIGIMWTIKSLLEVPIFFIGTSVLRKFKANRLLQTSAFMFTIQFLLWVFSTKVSTILVISSMQIFTFPLVLLSSKILIDNLSSEACKSTGQLLAMSIYSGGSSLITPYLSGVLTSAFDVNITLVFAAGFGFIAFLLSLFVKSENN